MRRNSRVSVVLLRCKHSFPKLACVSIVSRTVSLLKEGSEAPTEIAARVVVNPETMAAAELTDEAMTVFMLRHLRQSTAFLVVSERLQRKLLKHLLQLFGQGETAARVQAILFIRQMAVVLPPPTLSLAMKVCSPLFRASHRLWKPYLSFTLNA